MNDPKQLTAEEFFPFAVYGAHLEVARQQGLGILRPPAPDCPTCDEHITEIRVRDDYQFAEDIVWLAVDPCGHRFTIPGQTVYEASTRAAIAIKETG